MTTENQQMLQQLGQLHDDMAVLPSEIRAALAEAQGGFAALSNNMVGVAQGQVEFICTLDPDDPAPTNVAGGVFNTMADIVAASARAARLYIQVPAGRTVVFGGGALNMHRRSALFIRSGAGANPVFQIEPYVENGLNRINAFDMGNNTAIELINIDVALPTAKADDAVGWGVGYKAAIIGQGNHQRSVRLLGTTITGGINNELHAAAPGHGGVASVQLRDVLADGPLNIVGDCVAGVTLLSTYNTTLANGGVLHQGGTLGTNLLKL